MAKKRKKAPRRTRAKVQHPTLFVLEGSILYFEDGSMLELHAQITPQEWITIVEETVKYEVFLQCLKDVAIPLLQDQWTAEDDWFRLQMGIAVSRMRNIDPLLVAKYNQDEITKKYTVIMEQTAPSVLKLVEETRKEHRDLLREKFRDKTSVTDL